jgi:hypothetical protein
LPLGLREGGALALITRDAIDVKQGSESGVLVVIMKLSER